MINHDFPFSQLLSLTLILLSLHLQFPTTTSNHTTSNHSTSNHTTSNHTTSNHSSCSYNFTCGPSIKAVGFPFWGGLPTDRCGHPGLRLYCMRNTTMINIMGVAYSIRNINQTAQTLRISRADYQDESICSRRFTNATAHDPMVFEYAPGYQEFTMLYECSAPVSGAKIINCTNSGTRYLVRSVKGSEPCESKLRIGSSVKKYEELPSVSNPMVSWFGTFDVKYKFDSDSCGRCEGSGGVCGYEWSTNQNTCYCHNQTTCLIESSPKTDGPSNLKLIRVAIGISTAFLGIITISTVVLYYRKSTKEKSDDELEVEKFIKNYGSSAPKEYSYKNIKKMTNSFAEKIGTGGFGTVYKGRLCDGCPVAVKVLNETKGNGEDFINEVASMGRTSHVNVVTLFGFCYKGNKRALVYEYMPNGSLDKFIFKKSGNQSESNISRLGWETLYNIALGIARGLEYLHRGCKTRILHFDIKPQNILLDEEFCPKISDFGLAKLWLTKDSLVTMMGARGTIGYIAPEAFSGKVSYKSDVYSFGMLVLEMVGGRKNFDSGVSRTSEIYFPNSIYKDLEQGEDLGVDGVATEEERKLLKKMILVSFWCIQTHPSDRPSMSSVIEMLEGSLESLEIPPKPYLFSPSRSRREVTKDYVHSTSFDISSDSVVQQSAKLPLK